MTTKTTIGGLNEAMPEVNWTQYYETIFDPVFQRNGSKIDASQPVMLYSLEYFDNLFELLNTTSDRSVIQSLPPFFLLSCS